MEHNPYGVAGRNNPEESRIPSIRGVSIFTVIFILFLALAIFALDLYLPLGVAGGVPYVVLIAVGWWLRNPNYVFFLAAAAHLLTLLGLHLSPEGILHLSPDGGMAWMVLVNRAYAILAIWVTAIVLWLAMRARVLHQKKESELKEAGRRAEAANSAKSGFLRSMSHEFRTPLNAIAGYSQMLNINPFEPLTPKQREYTQNIIASAGMLIELIDNLLDIEAIEEDGLFLSMDDVDLDTVIGECVNMVSPSALDREVTIDSRLAATSQFQMRIDKLRLKQVMLNLLSNAVKYNRPGGRVILNNMQTEDGFLKITVSDTGIGIPPEHYTDIFKPFDRLGLESEKTIKGSGVGLTVTKQLVERMGGRIGFESKEQEGTTFWVDLPVARHDHLPAPLR